MMDSLFLSTIRRACFCSLALLLIAIIPSVSLGQLRTGRGQRVLYRDAAIPAGSQRLSEQAEEVAFANYQEVVSAPDSYAVDSVSGASTVQHAAACSGCSECSVATSSGCQGGCSIMGCSDCNGKFGIAPTASGMCPTDCGPILSLWYRLSVRAEVPMYWRRDQGPPALVTTSAVGTGADIAGELGQTSTEVLLGQGTLQDDATAGVRLTFSTWLGPKKCYGVILRYWNAGDQDLSFNFNSATHPILARPFFDTTISGSETQETQLIAFPNESEGSIAVNTQSEVGGIELMLRRELYADRFNRLNWLWGYQHLQVNEGLNVLSNTTVTGAGALQGTSISVLDSFQTENEFHGVVYGLMNTRRFANFRMETMFRLGAGNLERRVRIAGQTTTSSGGVSNTVNQGLLARNTNSQPFVDDTFIVIPELAINLGYRFRPGLDFNLGYNYMVIPKVAQAAQQLDNDLAVNLSDPLTGALDPTLDFVERQFWLHSLGFGLQLRY